MFRIDNATAAASLPAPALAGTPGYFTNGDPAAGTPRTIVDQDWFNMIQEELLAILAAASIDPDKADRGQVLAAILSLIAGGAPHVTSESLVENGGYRIWSTGYKECWGKATLSPDSDTTIDFPDAVDFTTFANVQVSGGIYPAQNTENPPHVVAVRTDGFDVSYRQNSNAPVWWSARGK